MTLAEIMKIAKKEPGVFTARVSDDWQQGRSAFGGLQGAFALGAMRTLVPSDMPLRTFQMTFVAPVGNGEHVTRAQVMRAGKNTMHVEAKIQSGDDVLAHAIGIFGHARESIVRRELPAAPSRAKGTRIPFVADLTPNFFQHFDVTLIEGDAPFSGSRATRNVFALGMNEPGNTTDAHLIALADFVPPVALSWLSKPTPGSSMTWMLEFLDHGFVEQPLRDWIVATEMVAAKDGYTSQSTTLWSPAGLPTVLSRQSMVVFG